MIEIRKPTNWIRVSANHVCPICKKPDWCTIATDGAICCMRVMSDRTLKNGGWLHKTDTARLPVYIPPVKPKLTTQSLFGLWNEWVKDTTPSMLMEFSDKILIDAMALYLMGCAWSFKYKAWSFPMYDEEQNIIGLRLRSEDGRKWSVTGSRSGLFLSRMPLNDKRIMIVEGATDAACAVAMGYSVIGRPSCMGHEDLIANIIHRNKIKEVVIVSDNDEAKIRPNGSKWYPGQEGSLKLQSMLKVKSCILMPPAKDFRESVSYGMTLEVVESMLRDQIWTVPGKL